MLSDDKVQMFTNVRKETRERLEALKSIDPVLYSHSRVIAECIDGHLGVVEERVAPFRKPSRTRPHRAQRVGV